MGPAGAAREAVDLEQQLKAMAETQTFNSKVTSGTAPLGALDVHPDSVDGRGTAVAPPAARAGEGGSQTAAEPRRRRQSTGGLELEPGTLWVERAAEWLLIAVLAFMPPALGVISPWSEMVVVATTGLLAICVAAAVVVRREPVKAWTWAYVPIALYVLLILVQLAPLPSQLVRAISPETAALRERLLTDTPGSSHDGMTLSLYSYAGWRDLRLVLVATTLFVSVIYLYRRTDQIKRLLFAMSVIGGAIGVLALVQQLTGADKIFWVVPTYFRADSGTFINHSHYSQFMNLSIGAALGLLLVRMREELRQHFGVGQLIERLRDPEFRSVWWLVGVVVVGAVTICLSMSRGGMLSMFVALTFTTLALARRQKMRALPWVLTLVGMVAFLGVLYAGFDAVADRLATLRNAEDPSSGRFQIYKDVGVAFRQFPLLGTGQGTWDVVYPMFDRSTIASHPQYADSDYAQALFETGAVGVSLVLIFAALIWTNYARAIRADQPAVCVAAFGLGYGLLAVMLHGFTDYGQHMPAIAGPTAVTCGLLVCLARKAGEARNADLQRRRGVLPEGAASLVAPSSRMFELPRKLALPVLLIAGLAWALLSGNSARVAANHASAATAWGDYLESEGWKGPDGDFAAMLSSAEAASAAEPSNVHHRYWLNYYRWRSISRNFNADSGELTLSDADFALAHRAVAELHEARLIAPTFGKALSLAGQLELMILNRPEEGYRHIRTGYALHPTDPAACFAAASLDVLEGNWEESLSKFRRCLKLDEGMFGDVVATYVAMDRPDLALTLAEGNPYSLQRLFTAFESAPEYVELVNRAQDEFVDLMASDDMQQRYPSAVPAAAAIHRKKGNHELAVEYYRNALVRNYDQVEWRLAIADSLAELGRTDEAIRELRLCLRLKPNWPPAKKLLEELSVRRAADAAKSGDDVRSM